MNNQTRNVLIGIGVIAALVFFFYPSELDRCIDKNVEEIRYTCTGNLCRSDTEFAISMCGSYCEQAENICNRQGIY
jgi:hypothetical protein